MTADPCGATRLLVQAELDGELDAAQVALLSNHLQSCPDCAAEQAELAGLSALMRRNVSRHAAPASLRDRVVAGLPQAKRDSRPFWNLPASFGAGMALAASVAFAVWPGRNDIAAEIVSAHIRALQPGHLVDVESGDQHTVKPWFEGRLDFAPTVRDPASQGFPLAGARLDYLPGHAVAALVYHRRLHVIDVFVWPMDRIAGGIGQDGTVQGYNVIGWTQDGMSYKAVSDLNIAELTDFTRLMQTPGA